MSIEFLFRKKTYYTNVLLAMVLQSTETFWNDTDFEYHRGRGPLASLAHDWAPGTVIFIWLLQ